MVDTKEPSKDTILADRDVIVGDVDILKTEDERSPPLQLSFRRTTSDEEPCEGTLPVENDDILDNTDAVDAEAPSENGPPPESSFCGIFGSNEIILKKDERSPPLQLSFRRTTSDEEPCEGTLPVENDDILDNTDAVDAEAPSENGPPPESSFCGIFGSNEIILKKAAYLSKHSSTLEPKCL
ncbi:uncharacterized protein [Dermacentor andersoni]|uniref:uncharacterized protein n=1 Tax=Dermacentor andersoni TaxID=34620 RepID=UPI003B3B91B7